MMAITLTLEDVIIPYLVLVFNSLVFYLLRLNLTKIAPASIDLFLSEIVSTVELCADCAELGVVWEVHGNIGLSVALFLLCVWWSFVFGDAEACPCGPIEECLIVGRSFTSADIMQKLTGQLVGAYLTYKYINGVWCWHLSEQHAALHTQPNCQAALFVTPVFGAAIEGLITFISRIVALQSEEWSASVSIILNSATTVVLVLFGKISFKMFER